MPTRKLHRCPYLTVLLVHWGVRLIRLFHDLPQFIQFLVRGRL